MRSAAAILLLVLLPALCAAQGGAAQYVGRTVTSVELVTEGRPTPDADLIELVQTKAAAPLSIIEVRDTIAHFFSTGRFQDVQVHAEDAPGGVRLRYNLIPVHGVERIEFRASGQDGLGLPERLLRRTVTERFGARPPVGRAADVVRVLDQLYKDRGYWMASIRAMPQELHDPDRTVLAFDISAGPRARVGRIEVIGRPVEGEAAFLSRIGLAAGDVYERAEIQRELTNYVNRLKKDGRYEAVASQRPPRLSADGTTADVTIDVQPGPIVTIAFQGDPLPDGRKDDLVPVEREGSADEDLLEDSARRIEAFLQQQGYWKARATFHRLFTQDQLTVVFTVRRGLLYRLGGGVDITGNRAVPASEIQPILEKLELRDQEPYVASDLSAAVSAIAALYRLRGYAQVKVDASENERNPVRAGEGLVRPAIVITEGPMIRIGRIVFEGSTGVPESELRAAIASTTGEPFVAQQIAADRDAVLLRYLNDGYASANVVAEPRLTADGTTVDLHFRIHEGTRIFVDHIIIVGNRRTNPQVIQRELLLRPGEPLGLEDRIESQRRLGALGLFRRVRVQPVSHDDSGRQDVLVTVEEAPATTIGYGGGLEASRLPRPTGPGGAPVEELEFAPRGFFDIGRRNLGGKNRSVNLYTRFSFRPDDDVAGQGSRFGFVDYRVVATYRQPRLLGANDATITGALEQGVRSSFNFARKGANAEVTRRLTSAIRAGARYSFGTTKTFVKGLAIEDPTSIDRLFPAVRLSQFSGAVSRDTRDDLVDPTRGTFVSAEGSIAARAIGGQVGFLKSYVQAFWFRQLPGSRGSVFASRVAVGLADGFQRTVEATDAAGNPIPGQTVVVEDLPASERFFAGGDTTIRGFALDRVGQATTISPTGFPQGGNAVLIANAELRVPVWGDVGGVVFVDGGNVFRRATQFDLGDLRGSVGFGVRYKSPVGPVRLDLGFKLDRRVLGGQLEPRRAFHFSIGHAF